MVRASFVLHTEESGCNGKKSKSYDEIASDIMFDIKVSELEKNVDVRCLSWVNFVTVALESTDFSLSTIGNGRITPECLFILANNYTLGSAEFNDIYDLAARLFPDSSEAGINAAAVALGKRDIRKTRKYISRFSTCQTAFNNMGVLCMLEGNYEKPSFIWKWLLQQE